MNDDEVHKIIVVMYRNCEPAPLDTPEISLPDSMECHVLVAYSEYENLPLAIGYLIQLSNAQEAREIIRQYYDMLVHNGHIDEYVLQ